MREEEGKALLLFIATAQNKNVVPNFYWKQKTGRTNIPEDASLVLLGEVDLILGALRCGLAFDQILPEFVILFKNLESIGLVKRQSKKHHPAEEGASTHLGLRLSFKGKLVHSRVLIISEPHHR